MPEIGSQFERLAEIVDELRLKCPWDRKQTKESIRHLTIEETYELADAILKGDYAEIKEELGDLVMHTLFYASMARDEGEFDMAAVLEDQIEKLIRRHPHVYGDLVGATEEEINANWEIIKAQERKMKGIVKQQSVLDGVPDSMPSLIKAQRMQDKAANVGFDWHNLDQVLDKVLEELTELKEAKSEEEREAEMGDLLFSIVNYCRFVGINAENALAKTNQKFKKRFQYIESQAAAADKALTDLSLEEMEGHWQEAKRA